MFYGKKIFIVLVISHLHIGHTSVRKVHVRHVETCRQGNIKTFDSSIRHILQMLINLLWINLLIIFS